MEIIIIFSSWAVLLYFIRLKRELSEYRKYFRQHDDIYVPSYKELAETNHWSIELAKYLSSQVKGDTLKKAILIIPTFRKRLNEIGMVIIGKRD
ncbi:MAG: hypothetical protein NTX22_08910 [Ignavibacteriales bacterium]|nr:hypothetical protein [Ignavibacteriales bacterium]